MSKVDYSEAAIKDMYLLYNSMIDKCEFELKSYYERIVAIIRLTGYEVFANVAKDVINYTNNLYKLAIKCFDDWQVSDSSLHNMLEEYGVESDAEELARDEERLLVQRLEQIKKLDFSELEGIVKKYGDFEIGKEDKELIYYTEVYKGNLEDIRSEFLKIAEEKAEENVIYLCIKNLMAALMDLVIDWTEQGPVKSFGYISEQLQNHKKTQKGDLLGSWTNNGNIENIQRDNSKKYALSGKNRWKEKKTKKDNSVESLTNSIDWDSNLSDMDDNQINCLRELINKSEKEFIYNDKETGEKKDVKERISSFLAKQDGLSLDKLLLQPTGWLERFVKGKSSAGFVMTDSLLHSLLKIKDGTYGKRDILKDENIANSFGLKPGDETFKKLLEKIKDSPKCTYSVKDMQSKEKLIVAGQEFSDFNTFIKDGLKKDARFIEPEKKYFDKELNEISKKEAPPYYKVNGKLIEADIKKSVSITKYQKERIGKKGIFSGSVKAVKGRLEGTASLRAGKYIGEDSDKRFSGGVEAEKGKSFTGFEKTYEGKIGGENTALSGNFSYTFLKLEGKAKGGVKLISENGGFNPQISGDFSVEALAGKVEVQPKIKLLGAEGSVTISGNIGVGAHVKYDFKDGIFRFDVGLTLGVGASFKLSFDIKGVWKGICSVAKTIKMSRTKEKSPQSNDNEEIYKDMEKT